MPDEQGEPTVSRRSAIKRIGLATGAVWAAPALTAIGRIPAHAQASGRVEERPEFPIYD